eukprot:gb/GFBE01082465.1/.p1 GENE.gb/GFBE01082465.1/~~gb/GFBE01082465.1/.p1  ORF type:complete len:597 (+),score=141.99 gb/GFBE01082465.1/:1-1791(+)
MRSTSFLFRLGLVLTIAATADAGVVHRKSHGRLRSRKHARSRTADVQEPGVPTGSVVRVHGLKSAVDLNGQEAVVEGFDDTAGRYLLKMLSTGAYKKVTPDHLDTVPFTPYHPPAESSQQLQEQEQDLRPPAEWPALAGGEHAAEGDRVVLSGLVHDQTLNGQTAVVKSFDMLSGRFTVTIGSKIAKRIKPANLRLGKESTNFQAQSAGGISVCQSSRSAETGPGGLSPGAQVLLRGLASPASAPLNGQSVIIHCFDTKTSRYVVELPDGTPREIKPQNLALQEAPATPSSEPLTDAVAAAEEPVPVVMEVLDEAGTEDEHGEESSSEKKSLAPGARAHLVGLKAKALNGKAVKVVSFDDATQRWLVQLPDASVRKVEASKLQLADQAPHARLTFCNAYGRGQQLQIKALEHEQDLADGKNLGGLDFQACVDYEEWPLAEGSFSFIVGSKEVARTAFDAKADVRGKEYIVRRAKKDSATAEVHENAVEADDQAYYLHLINAYSGSRATQLSVQRGPVAKVLPLDKTYRMEKVEDLSLTLADGHRHLKLAFKPQKSRTYCVVVTGGDTSEKDTAERAGLILHEIGKWTSAEELADKV